jgi:hypothetical protein
VAFATGIIGIPGSGMASFTVYALSRLGYVDEGQHFVRWIKDRLHWDGAHGPWT